MEVSFQMPQFCFTVRFNASECAQFILKHLPLDAKVNTWSDGVYFKANIGYCSAPKARTIAPGDVVFWPEGSCIGVFFGTAPMQIGEGTLRDDDLVLIGTTEVNREGFLTIRPEDDIRVAAVSVVRPTLFRVDPSQNPERKLTQEEIDVLVQQLLAQKKKT